MHVGRARLSRLNCHTRTSLSFSLFNFDSFFVFVFQYRVQNITNEQFCIQVMLYTRTGGVLQICSTVHIISILRIYIRSLINSNKKGKWGREKKKDLYETSIAIKSQTGCRGNCLRRARSATTLLSPLTNDA